MLREEELSGTPCSGYGSNSNNKRQPEKEFSFI